MDVLVTVLALRMGGYIIRPGRVLSAALAGACVAYCARLTGGGRTASLLLWLPTAALMMAIGGGRRAKKRPVRSATLLLCAAGLVGGIVQALHGATGSLTAAYVLGCMAAVWIALSAMRTACASKDARNAQVLIRMGENEAVFDALVDSGNTLRDYLTHRPVIVLAQRPCERALGLEGRAMRPIFAETAGGRLMMCCFVPEKTELMIAGEWKTVQAAAALSPEMTEGMPALVPAALLCQEGEAGERKEKQRGI